MLRTHICVVTLFLCAAVCVASTERKQSAPQSHPDLSGTWRLDKSKGNYVQYSGLNRKAELVLVISHVDPEIKATRRLSWNGNERVQDLTYFSDGRGETNPTLIDEIEVKSKTKWNGNKLISEYSVSPKSAGGLKFTLDVIGEWKLSADGRTLTQTERATARSSSLTVDAGAPRIGMPPSGLVLAVPNETKKVFQRVP